MHVVFFNRSYYPDVEATGQYLTELAEDLVARGVRVSVVCGRGNYGEEGVRFLPLGVYVRHGVRIVRVSNTRLPKSSFTFRLINLATYLAGSLLALFFVARPHVVVCQTDPPLLPLVAGTYARLAGACFVFAVNDLYPDVAVELNEISNPFWLRLLDFATSFGLRRADLVTVLGRDMKAKVIAKACPPRKISLVPHWADTESIRPCKENNRFRRRLGLKASDFVVMYSGNIGVSQNLEQVLRVAAGFRGRGDLHFLIVGGGARKDRLKALASRLELNGKVRFLPYQPRGRLAESLSAADLHLVPLSKGVSGSIVPCKVYGIMASGTPYLAVAEEGSEPVRIARRYGCGLWCPPGSPEHLKQQIEFALSHRQLLKSMGRKGRMAATRQFSRPVGTGRYLRLLRSLV